LNGQHHQVAFTHPQLPAEMIVTDLGTAQAALGLGDEALSSIAVLVDTPLGRLLQIGDRLLPGFSAGFELPDWTLPAWQVRTIGTDIPGLTFGRSVLFNLGALGSLALVVAWLLVYQVGVMWLRRRQQTFERLRQMGVSDRELRFGFLLGLGGVGLAASLVGIWVGDGLARILIAAISDYPETNDPVSQTVNFWVVVKGFGSAVLVCVLGGWFAFARESRGNVTVAGWWASIALVVSAGLSGIFISDSLLGGFVGIVAVGLVVLAGIAPMLAWLRGVSQHLGGRLLARVGLRELVWYPRDLAVAVAALTLALATSVAMALMVDSFRHDFEEMLDRRMVHDLFVVSDRRDLSELATLLVSRPDVDYVQRYGRDNILLRGLRTELGYTTFDQSESARYGLGRPLGALECVLNERLARALNIRVGESLTIGSLPIRVAGIFAGFGDPTPRVLVSVDLAEALEMQVRFDRLSIRTAEPEAVIGALAALDPLLEVEERGSLRTKALRIFDQTFAITRALTLLALFVASVGLYNTLLALQLLQQHTRDLLHAMGVSRQELRSVDRWRVIGVGSAALAFAMPLGLIMGWLLCRVINPRAFGWSLNLQVEWAAFVWPVVSAIVAMTGVLLLPTPSEEVLDES